MAAFHPGFGDETRLSLYDGPEIELSSIRWDGFTSPERAADVEAMTVVALRVVSQAAQAVAVKGLTVESEEHVRGRRARPTEHLWISNLSAVEADSFGQAPSHAAEVGVGFEHQFGWMAKEVGS